MKNGLLDDIIAAIKNINFLKLIGKKENLYFEAKPANEYNLEQPEDRYELAKDVSAFANSEGGLLVIGLKTETMLEENTDRIMGLDLLNKTAFSINKYHGVINEYIHPKIENVKIEWFQNKDDEEKGLGCIYIPKQTEDKKYFLIKNIIEKKQAIKGFVFGIIQRIGSDNIPLTIDQLYTNIQKGKSKTAEQLTRIEDKIDILIEKEKMHLKPEETPIKELDERIKRIQS